MVSQLSFQRTQPAAKDKAPRRVVPRLAEPDGGPQGFCATPAAPKKTRLADRRTEVILHRSFPRFIAVVHEDVAHVFEGLARAQRKRRTVRVDNRRVSNPLRADLACPR